MNSKGWSKGEYPFKKFGFMFPWLVVFPTIKILTYCDSVSSPYNSRRTICEAARLQVGYPYIYLSWPSKVRQRWFYFWTWIGEFMMTYSDLLCQLSKNG
jgi:hypothetical protein